VRVTLVTFAEALRRLAPISSASTSYTVRFSPPSLVSYDLLPQSLGHDRPGAAAHALGDDKPVRLAGVHAMAGLAEALS
jgi:hypothetical protein